MAKQNFLEGEFNLPELETKVLKFWNEEKIFEKSLDQGKGEPFIFYEGPPYANGKPAIHHVLSRVVKDAILRYQTMRGRYVPRRAGWDTHGLPVEMAAEKALGFKSKKDIEKFGVQRFNEEAKKQVWIYKDEWERLTDRIGYWLDLKNAYVTYAPEYIETIWWTLAQIWKRKLLYKGHKVVPWCTRCGTALSSHELAQGYKEVVDHSVYVKFKLKAGQKIGNFKTDGKTYILSWTTTPWTLPGNVALAVGEGTTYIKATLKSNQETYIFAKDTTANIWGGDFGVIEGSGFGEKQIDLKDESLKFTDYDEVKGRDLLGLEYEPLFEVSPLKSENSYKIYPADFVTTTDGTGVVHTAVMYGEDDYELGKKVGLPQHHTVDEEGNFTKDVPALAGEYAKSEETEAHIFEHLQKNGNLLRTEKYKHEYPFCWRCGTAILYYARTSWFIAMSRLREELLKRNETVNWMPEHVKQGRFGEWLREAKDWNLSRERYWGAPLPIWECEKCGHTEVVESLAALDRLAGGAKNKYWAVRHGESENIAFHIIDSGDQNCRLTPHGEAQVVKAAKKLKTENIDLIFASDLLRTKASAEIIAKEIGAPKIIFDKRLREINLGSLSGKPSSEYAKRLPTQEERFAGQAAPGAESLREVRTRVWNFLKDTEQEYAGKNILIVSHEDTIWMLSEVALGWNERVTAEKKNGNGGVFMEPAEIIELRVKAIPRDDTGELDMHRPFIDKLFLACHEDSGKCGGKMKRVPTIADVWYDSGAMPYAQAHFPFDASGKVRPAGKRAPEDLAYPAEFIAEGMDQTRGWFYTMLAIATALDYEAPYKNVITFGLVNDKSGQKMSKSKGNVVEPFGIIDKYGVDAIRWYFYSGTPLGEPKRFDEQDVGKVLRKVHLIVYNSFVFWKTYSKKGIQPENGRPRDSKNLLDTWILTRMDELVVSVTKKLDHYQIRESALEIEVFIDDLSRWYIRRSRKRLQRPENDGDYEAASITLGAVLLGLIKIMAPFTPFFSEILYSAMGAPKESVHLEIWPEKRSGSGQEEDKKVIRQMQVVREFAALGLARRAEAGIKSRQPLASLMVAVNMRKTLDDKAALAILADEVNVKEIIFDPALAEGVALDIAVTPELRDEGLVREVARAIQELRQKAGLSPKDEIMVMLELPAAAKIAVTKNEKNLKTEVGAKTIEYKKSDTFTAEEIVQIDKQDAWIGLKLHDGV